MPPVLYAHPFSSYCQKVLIALYENATPFEMRILGAPGDPANQELRTSAQSRMLTRCNEETTALMRGATASCRRVSPLRAQSCTQWVAGSRFSRRGHDAFLGVSTLRQNLAVQVNAAHAITVVIPCAPRHVSAAAQTRDPALWCSSKASGVPDR